MERILYILIILLGSSLVFAQSQDDDDDEDDNEVDSEYITRAEIPFAGNVEILWKLNTFVKVVDHAIIDKDKIYVTIADEGRDFGQVWAMDKKSGKILWKSEKQEGIPLHAAKLDGNNLVFSTRRAIVSLNKSNGKTNWVAFNPYSKMIGSDCAIFMDVIVASTSDNNIFGVSKKDGKIIWEKEIKEMDTPSLLVYKNDVIVAESEDGITSLDAKTGRVNWRIETPSSFMFGIEKNLAYVGNGDRGYICLNLDSGKKVWSSDVNDGNPFVNGHAYFCASDFTSAPLIIGNNIYGGDYTHTVASFDKLSGKLLWVDYYPGLNRNNINLYNNKLLLSSEQAITILNLDGTVDAKYKIPTLMTDPKNANDVTADGEALILTNRNGKIARVILKRD
jgi:outer membrane protein assembly factor BamB